MPKNNSLKGLLVAFFPRLMRVAHFLPFNRLANQSSFVTPATRCSDFRFDDEDEDDEDLNITNGDCCGGQEHNNLDRIP